MDQSKPVPITHPGVILNEEFLKPFQITQAKLAEKLSVGHKTINEICNEKRSVTPTMALKLSKLFGTSPQFWLNLQSGYDLYKSYKKNQADIEKIKAWK